jgi:hypothetical protein
LSPRPRLAAVAVGEVTQDGGASQPVVTEGFGEALEFLGLSTAEVLGALST